MKLLADWLTYSIFKLQINSHAAEAVNFFIYDTIKILLLLAVIIFSVSLIRSFIPPKRIREILAKKNRYVSHIMAAIFGIITPFCTCSAIPLFMGFIEAGVPLAVTFSFLVASPMINEVAMVLLFASFGWKITAVYIGSGLFIAIVAGILIGRFNPEKLLETISEKSKFHSRLKLSMKWGERVEYAKDHTLAIIKKVWIYILLGVGAGAWIHGYVPTDFLAQYAGADKWYAVPFATLIGIPLYSNAAGVIPLVSVLAEKGVGIGTTLAFMMAVTALSFPEFMILKRLMKTKLIVIFATIVGVGIIFTGYLFNYLL